MKVMVIGSGGREHAIVWKLSLSPRISEIICVPGNAWIEEVAQCIPFNLEDIEGLADLAEKKRVDISIVGPELPLTLGIVNVFEKRGLKIFGPSKEAAIIEGSKSFAKDFLNKYNIPTAKYAVFSNSTEAKNYIKEESNFPLVIKADGLAAGKGVLICHNLETSLQAIDTIMEDRTFGKAGEKVVVEEFLEGEEASFMVFSDGESVLPMPSAQDHKRVFDGDLGPNTGGMGAYSPAPVVTDSIQKKIMTQVIIPTIKGMKKEGRLYKGVLYAGLMIHREDIKVLEFNCRFGDPETQPVLMRLKTDLLPILSACIEGRLQTVKVEWKKESAVCVVMTSKGYPSDYQKGQPISISEEIRKQDGLFVFHSGTSKNDGKLVANGGRVLGVTGLGSTLKAAVEKTYTAIEKIDFEGHFRKDIGYRAIS